MQRFFLTLLFVYCLPFYLLSSDQQRQRVTFDANSMEMDPSVARDARRLIGNVSFHHEGAVMTCDSAYFYAERNALDAFGNVVVNRGDTLFLYSNKLFYDGNTKQIKAREQVRLVDDSTVLYTELLYFDMDKDVGFYPDGGLIISGNDTLSSIYGRYYAQKNAAHFTDSVELRMPDYRIYTDTLQYNTDSKVARFLGPTHVYGDSSYIYCEKGVFYTEMNIAELSVRACVIEKSNRIKGDSIYFNETLDFVEAFRFVEISDTTDEVTLYGHYGLFYLSVEEGYVADSALLVQIDERGDSLYMHADTLFTLRDTLHDRVFKANYHVKIYNHSFQAVADSAMYFSLDSTMRLFLDPVMWVEGNQMTASQIILYVKGEGIDSVWMHRDAFIVDKETGGYYNQIKGRDIMNYFKDNEIFMTHVKGNAETIYYPKDEETGVIEGMNTAEALEMYILMDEGKIGNIRFSSKPKGTMYPLEEIPEEKLFLRGFRWLIDDRPNTFEDVFIRRQR